VDRVFEVVYGLPGKGVELEVVVTEGSDFDSLTLLGVSKSKTKNGWRGKGSSSNKKKQEFSKFLNAEAARHEESDGKREDPPGSAQKRSRYKNR
jgi:hypothetical protein